ncbi:MAG TPA: hypothetical protein VN524_13035 [Hyphomicrobiaceae bacterium]|jgi:hypothetical protein|nr:hypothetical protein [Hyphomicrobiaceae bacterium]
MAPAKRSTEGRSRVPLLLGLAAVAAAVLLWDRWADWGTGAAGAPGVAAPDKATPDKAGSETTALGVDTEPRGDGGSALPLASLSLDKLHDTVRRPLFEKTRRPVEPPVVAAPPAPAPVIPKRLADPNALTLLGVLTSDGPGTGAIALMRRNQTGQSVRLQEGDTVDGWTIERIEAARVHLRQGDTRFALELFRRR